MAFLRVIELNGLDQFPGVRLGPVDLAIRRHGDDKILVQSDATVRGDPYVAFGDPGVHDPGDSGCRWIAHVDPVDGAESINNVHETVIDEGRALMAAQRHEPNAGHAT